jgi:S-DNA-T family DNA segregation ATPase FtsK/SpoIIIE
MPFIVIIIDEMADVMLHAQKEVEKNLALIVAKSRAVGIHTIIATQRPDVKVITGTIKANYPVRIAFQVSSQIDARTIMDNKGAESLLGRGDMLFKGAGNIERIQGGWVDTPEIENIVNFVSAFADQEFDESVFQALEVQDTEERGRNGSAAGSRTLIPGLNEEMDSEERLIQDAIEVVLRDRRPTISYLQRTLKVGYNKAATLIDELEDRGIIGPQPSSGLREILVLAPPTRDADDDDSGKVSNLDDV